MDVLFGLLMDTVFIRWFRRIKSPYQKVLVSAGFLFLGAVLVVVFYSIFGGSA